MRISDWSSDMFSSDLVRACGGGSLELRLGLWFWSLRKRPMPRPDIFRTRCRSFGLDMIESTPVMLHIPQAAPLLRHQRFRSAIDAALNRVLDGGNAILGPGVTAFEAEFAAYCVWNRPEENTTELQTN